LGHSDDKLGNSWRKLRASVAPLLASGRLARISEVSLPPPVEANPLAVLKATGFVDSAWYFNQYLNSHKSELNPEDHYFAIGAKQGLNPNPLFRTKWYVEKYGASFGSVINPAFHYLAFGSKLGLKPNALFDPLWYRRAYQDVDKTGMEPLIHYLRYGAREGRNPSEQIFTAWLPKRIDPLTGDEKNPLAAFLDLQELLWHGANWVDGNSNSNDG
jgi:hypothetical protein